MNELLPSTWYIVPGSCSLRFVISRVKVPSGISRALEETVLVLVPLAMLDVMAPPSDRVQTDRRYVWNVTRAAPAYDIKTASPTAFWEPYHFLG